MYLGTHACLPLVAASITDIFRVISNRKPLFSGWQLFFIALAGTLPDLLWPHMSRQARLSSWTHTIWFLIGVLPIIYLVAKKVLKKNLLVFVLFFWLAIVLHVFMDGISGGVSLLYPIYNVFGHYYIPWPLWLKIDLFMMSISFTIIFLRHRIIQIKINKGVERKQRKIQKELAKE